MTLTTKQKAERYDRAVAWVQATWTTGQPQDALAAGIIYGRREVYDILMSEEVADAERRKEG
jgi:hypothetical protein